MPINPIDSSNPASHSAGLGALKGQASQPRQPVEPESDRVELSSRGASAAGSSEANARAARLEALKDAIATGRYYLPDDAIARAMLRAAVER